MGAIVPVVLGAFDAGCLDVEPADPVWERISRSFRNRRVRPPRLMELQRGKLALTLAGVHALVLYVDCVALGRARTVVDVVTQSVHVAAVLGFTAIMAPYFSLRFSKVVVAAAAFVDAALCLLRGPGQPVAMLRLAADVGLAIAYALVEPSGGVDPAPDRVVEDDVARRANPRARSIGIAASLVYAVIHVWQGEAIAADVDEAIAYHFHYSYLTVGFVVWAYFEDDALPWWIAVVFSAIEAATLLGVGVLFAGPAVGLSARAFLLLSSSGLLAFLVAHPVAGDGPSFVVDAIGGA